MFERWRERRARRAYLRRVRRKFGRHSRALERAFGLPTGHYRV